MSAHAPCAKMIHSIENPFIPSIPPRDLLGDDEKSSLKLAVGLNRPVVEIDDQEASAKKGSADINVRLRVHACACVRARTRAQNTLENQRVCEFRSH